MRPKPVRHSFAKMRRALRMRSEKQRWSWWITAAVFFLLLAILSSSFTFTRLDLEVGDISPYDITAPRDVVNRYRTEAERQRVGAAAVRDAARNPENYDVNPAAVASAEARLDALLNLLDSGRNVSPEGAEAVTSSGAVEGASGEPGSSQPSTPSDPTGDSSSGGKPVPNSEASSAVPDASQGRSLEVRTAEVVRRAREQFGVTLTAEAVQAALSAPTDEYRTLKSSVSDLLRTAMEDERISAENLQAVRELAVQRTATLPLSAALRELSGELIEPLVVPNLLLNGAKVERIRQGAMGQVEPVRIQQGQIILRQADLVQEEHIQILRDLGMLDPQLDFRGLAGSALIVLLALALIAAYAGQYHREVLREPKYLGLIGLLLVAVTGTARVLSILPWEWAGFLTPVAFASILIGILLDPRFAVAVTLALTLLIGVVFGGEGHFIAVALLSGLAAIFAISKVSQRSDLSRAGFAVSVVSFVAILAFGLLEGDSEMMLQSWTGLGNGLFAAILSIGSLGYVESLVGLTSSIKLLELMNPHHPLLRKLLMEAPGTYHHSIMVGNLAEAACEAVGADGLLARVGAQYHDIGKTRRPYFFVENQMGDENPHDRLNPTLSTLIILSHVKDGVELARRHKLPSVLVDFIRTHHGTDLLKYFYQRASQQGAPGTVREKEFRYPGPKPRTRETGIVMLADSVEAATRASRAPTRGRVEALVRRLVKERLADGELDQCDLTLKDLDLITRAFVRVLTGIYHHRVEYPESLLREAAKREA